MEVKKETQDRRFYPLFLSKEGFGVEQSDQENREIWNDFDSLTREEKDTLLSYEIAENFSRLEKIFALQPKTTYKIILLVRSFLFKKINQNQILEGLSEIIEIKDVMVKVSNYIQKEIVELRVVVKNEEQESSQLHEGDGGGPMTTIVKLQILQALSQFPNLGNQTISQERIKIKSQPEPVRGSLYNWIKYYRDELGIGQHSTVERGQFLFRSENGKKLTSAERERVNLILKSLEENLPLEIDSEHQEIIFPEVQTTNGMPAPSQSPVIDEGMTPVSPIANITLEEKKTEFLPVQEVRLEAKPFIPKPPLAKLEPDAIAKKFEPSQSPYEKIAIPHQKPLSLESLPNMNIDVSQVAEKMKREPKPEWIKGAFTKESIPETTPIAPVAGSMTFSFNHALPAEQEAPQVAPVLTEQDSQSQAKVLTKKVPVKVQTGSSQFHIRPASRGDL